MDWGKKNYDRKNVCDTCCYSISFGILKKFRDGTKGPNGHWPAVRNERNPEVYKELQQLSSRLGFPATTFCCTKNLQAKEHKDSLNQGVSLIVGLGSYKGGELLVQD